MQGRFGNTVRMFTVQMLREGLVHDVASDAHDHIHRPPGLVEGFARMNDEIPGIDRYTAWYTVTSPVAILAGNPLPKGPDFQSAPPSRLRRLLGRS
jgi:hypothetical protein